METTLNLGKKGETAARRYLQLSDNNLLAVGVLLPNGATGYYLSNGVGYDSLFDIGSISKTFTAQAVLKLACENKLSLSDTVDKYLQLPSGVYPTVEMLLTHTAGYKNLTPVEITVPSLLKRSYARANVYRGIGETDVLNALSRRKHARASGYFYSDFAYALLGIVACRVTGKSISALLQELIDDYHMKSTYIIPDGERMKCNLRGHVIAPWSWESDNPYLASGGISSTVCDMLKYAKAQVEQVHDFTRMAQERRSIPASFGGPKEICLGWHTYSRSNQCWHVGGVGTFRSSLIFNPKAKCAVIVMGNAKGAKSANVHYLAKLLYSEMKRHHISILE
ncbi:MAG: beta-lactamase family protein [Clostridia bacterium]|nr:beta-lactamase family protein [Clostridia bacterium]